MLYLAVIVIAGTINVPLNNELARTGHIASLTELATARHHFQNRWVARNTARTLLNVGSFACLVVALTLPARQTATRTADLNTTGMASASPHAPGNATGEPDETNLDAILVHRRRVPGTRVSGGGHQRRVHRSGWLVPHVDQEFLQLVRGWIGEADAFGVLAVHIYQAAGGPAYGIYQPPRPESTSLGADD